MTTSSSATPRRRTVDIDARLRRIARSHHGVFDLSRAQAAGVSQSSLDRRVLDGTLERLHQTVYRFTTTPISTQARLQATWMAGGPGAVLLGRAAATAHGVACAPGLDVAIPPRRRLIIDGATVHRVKLATDDVVRLDRMTVSSLVRTVMDLAWMLSTADAERVLDDVLASRRITVDQLLARAARTPHQRGSLVLRSLLDDRTNGLPLRRSRAEQLLSLFLDEAGLGDGIPNLIVIDADGQERMIDVGWPPERVGLEFKSFKYHSTTKAWQRDHARDNALTAVGWSIVTATDEDLQERLRGPVRMIHALRQRAHVA